MMEINEDLRISLAKKRNSLSSERTRFASERTISSWIRTSLASSGAGFAIIRLIEFENINHRFMANIVGEILILWGIVILILALIDYTKTCQSFANSVNKRNQWWVSITVFVFIIVSFFLLYVTMT